MEVQNDIANVQGRCLAFSSDVGTACAQRGFHFGLDAEAHNLRWNLAPGQTKAIEYDANGKELRSWNYKYDKESDKFYWE